VLPKTISSVDAGTLEDSTDGDRPGGPAEFQAAVKKGGREAKAA